MNRERWALERLYRDRATIKGYVKTEKDGWTDNELTEIVTEEKCKVSLKSQRALEQGIVAQSNYDAKLYLSSEINVPDGAEIIITDVNGRVTRYKGSRPFGYANHQEIFMQYKERAK